MNEYGPLMFFVHLAGISAGVMGGQIGVVLLLERICDHTGWDIRFPSLYLIMGGAFGTAPWTAICLYFWP